MADKAQPQQGEWRTVSSERVRDLVSAVMECRQRTELPEDAEAKAIRLGTMEDLAEDHSPQGSRLLFHYAQDLYFRGLFSSEGRITEEMALQADRWIKHQKALRAALWPLDHSPDKYERTQLVVRETFSKSPGAKLSLRDLQKACHTWRPGSGGIHALQSVLKSLIAMGCIATAGTNRTGKTLFQWVGEE